MIEKRTMWLVENNLGEPLQVVAIYDTEKQEVITDRYTNDDGNEDESDDWMRVYDGERFFATRQEAEVHRRERISQAREKMNTCRALIEELDRIASQDDFQFEKSDYLGDYAPEDRKGYWYGEYQEAKDEMSLLCTIARGGYFNVNGETVRLADVSRVLWHDNKKATLVMADGHKVTTYGKTEYQVVVDMFGSNRSDRVVKEF